MKSKGVEERDKFDKVMDGLLSVPYKELQQKLEEKKKAKAERKRSKTSTASRVSSDRKS